MQAHVKQVHKKGGREEAWHDVCVVCVYVHVYVCPTQEIEFAGLMEAYLQAYISNTPPHQCENSATYVEWYKNITEFCMWPRVHTPANPAHKKNADDAKKTTGSKRCQRELKYLCIQMFDGPHAFKLLMWNCLCRSTGSRVSIKMPFFTWTYSIDASCIQLLPTDMLPIRQQAYTASTQCQSMMSRHCCWHTHGTSCSI